MSEKQDVAEESESLFDRIWQRLITVIPCLLLSSVFAFWVFKITFEKLGSSFFGVIVFGIIIIGMASVISITVGRKRKDRQLGLTLAFLIPLVASIEAAIQFGEPLGDMIVIGYMGLFLIMFVLIFVDNMLLPLVDTKNIKPEDVVCIQIFSPISNVTKLVEEVLSYLNISKVKKTSVVDTEKQWRFSSSNYPGYYYLLARSNNDNSVDLAFLNFTERPNKLWRSERNEKGLNFLKEIILSHHKLHSITCKSEQNTSISEDLVKLSLKKYKSAGVGKRLGDIGGHITELYKKYPWIFIIIASLSYPIIMYILKILRGMW